MATGDTNDFVARLKSVLPRWFSDTAPIANAILTGLATTGAFLYSLVTYAALQVRIATATDGFLDMISADFFGVGLPRYAGETDAAFRARIKANLLLPRGTRAGIIGALMALTGRTPRLFEPLRTPDTGCYGGPFGGYSVAGGYTNLSLVPYQALVVGYRGNGVADADIYAAVDQSKPAATLIWTAISN